MDLIVFNIDNYVVSAGMIDKFLINFCRAPTESNAKIKVYIIRSIFNNREHFFVQEQVDSFVTNLRPSVGIQKYQVKPFKVQKGDYVGFKFTKNAGDPFTIKHASYYVEHNVDQSIETKEIMHFNQCANHGITATYTMSHDENRDDSIRKNNFILFKRKTAYSSHVGLTPSSDDKKQLIIDKSGRSSIAVPVRQDLTNLTQFQQRDNMLRESSIAQDYLQLVIENIMREERDDSSRGRKSRFKNEQESLKLQNQQEKLIELLQKTINKNQNRSPKNSCSSSYDNDTAVSYITHKLLGTECPISNRFQSKIPDLHTVPMPLTEIESRHQRLIAAASAKSTANNLSDDTSTLGTAVNPRERPRGMIAPPGSLISFNQSAQRSANVVVPPPPPPPPPPVPVPPLVTTPSRLSHQRSGSAAQLMFDDDFSQFPSHALSLNSIPNMSTTPKTATTLERNVSRARPSPPASISSATGCTFQQQLFPPPPATTISSSNTQLTTSATTNNHQHRRSASQTMSPTNNSSSFQHASSVESNLSFDRRPSVDSSAKQEQQQQQQVLFIGEASDDDDDDALGTNLNKLKVHNHSTENVKSRESLILNEDDRLFAKTYTINSQLKSDDEQSTSSSSSHDNESHDKATKKNKKKSQVQITPIRSSHHPSAEETEKSISSPSTANKNLVKRLIGRCSLQQPQQQDEPTAASTPYKRKDSITLSNEHPIPMGDHSDKGSDSDGNNHNEKHDVNHTDGNNVGFDQLINEDSDDDDAPIQSTNTSKTNVASSRFMSSRHKEQQYEHFEDSDDDDNETSYSTAKSSNPTTKLFNLFSTNSKANPLNGTKRSLNEHNNQTNSSFIDNDNPFLHAPFHRAHRSPTHKQVAQSASSSAKVDAITTSNVVSFDPTSIVTGTRLSAFAPYHRQEPNSTISVVDSTSSAYSFCVSKQKIPHSESYPPGINNTSTSSNNQSSISKDVFTNAPFKPKLTPKQHRTMASTKANAISPTSSHSTSSSNSQLIDFTVPAQRIADSTSKEQLPISPTRRNVGSAGLATNFSTFKTINSTNDKYYFHSEHINNDGHSSSEELTSSSSLRKRNQKKKSSNNAGHDSQQHAYANLSFNDAIVDELL
ncbi:unnamed protein product [Rotaria magnacalcarata]